MTVVARAPARITVDDPRIVRLRAKILRLQSNAAKVVVDAVVEIGRHLRRARAMLTDAQWERFLRTLPFAARTVRNYLTLTEWAERRPAELAKAAHLGPSKLYLLAPLPANERRKFFGSRKLAIPGGDGPKTVDAMTVSELHRVIIGDLAPPALPKPPIDKVVRGVTHSVAGLDARLDIFIARKREVDRDTAAEVHTKLLALADEVGTAFGL